VRCKSHCYMIQHVGFDRPSDQPRCTAGQDDSGGRQPRLCKSQSPNILDLATGEDPPLRCSRPSANCTIRWTTHAPHKLSAASYTPDLRREGPACARTRFVAPWFLDSISRNACGRIRVMEVPFPPYDCASRLPLETSERSSENIFGSVASCPRRVRARTRDDSCRNSVVAHDLCEVRDSSRRFFLLRGFVRLCENSRQLCVGGVTFGGQTRATRCNTDVAQRACPLVCGMY